MQLLLSHPTLRSFVCRYLACPIPTLIRNKDYLGNGAYISTLGNPPISSL